MDDKPLISVVTPCFNSQRYVRDTIESVTNQDYSNVEYIVIDGGSSDATLDIINEYSDRIAFWSSEPDSGMYDALNKGFRRSTGEIMLWINSDDWLHPGALSGLAKIYTDNPHVEWLHACNSHCNARRQVVTANSPRKWSKYDYYLGDYRWIQQESISWRRSLWEESGGTLDPQLKYAGDLELWCRFFRFAPLHTAGILTGCMRSHPIGQLSQLYHHEYCREAQAILDNARQLLTNSERRRLRLIQFSLLTLRMVRSLRILNTTALHQLIRTHLFDPPSAIPISTRN
ncbi:glycosyltransferase [bacterium]|nr:glycosyltransferase [bacterium]